MTMRLIPALLLCVSTAAAAAEKDFSVECPTKTVFMLSGGRITFVNKKPKSVPRADPVNWTKFCEILQDGKPPEHGVFEVNGKPVKPSLSVVPQIAKNTMAKVEIREENNAYNVSFITPGKAVLRAEVGKAWRKDIAIEIRQLPVWQGMRAADVLENFGFPDTKFSLPGNHVELWRYEKCPDYVLSIAGEPGMVVELLHKSKLRRETLAELEKK